MTPLNLKKLTTVLTLCAATLACSAAPALAADNDTAFVDQATPNLAAAAQAMAAASQHHTNSSSNSSQAPQQPQQPTTPDVTVPDVTVPDTPSEDNTNDNDETIKDIVNGISDATAAAVISDAAQYIGVPYVWGGTTPAGFDCSGLVQYVFAANGISLPRTTYEQQAVVASVSLDELQPGDLVFWGESAYHVGIYIGDGQYIHAPAPGQSVCIQSYDAYPYTSAGRVLA